VGTSLRFANLGFIVKKVTINIDELIEYCRDLGIKNEEPARSMFVQLK
jgi:hypothetical protein